MTPEQSAALVELLGKMRAQLFVWEDEEPRDDWWNYQREYGEAFLRLESLTSKAGTDAGADEAAQAIRNLPVIEGEG